MKYWPVIALLVAAIAFGFVSLAGGSTNSSKIGGATCVAQTPNGVICRWPGKPWAVGITRYLVFVWRRDVIQFVRTNQ